MIAFKGQYRVLVLKSAEDSASYAVCLEQNLVGRGPDAEAAMLDLTKALTYAIAHELAESVPAYCSDPDPEIEQMFNDRSAIETAGGDLVLRRLTVDFTIELAEAGTRKQRARRTPHVTYQDLVPS